MKILQVVTAKDTRYQCHEWRGKGEITDLMVIYTIMAEQRLSFSHIKRNYLFTFTLSTEMTFASTRRLAVCAS